MSTKPFSPFGVTVVYINDEGVAPKGWVGAYPPKRYPLLDYTLTKST